jgi:Coenzyme PQQ synthesis protein D (PqqD)
MKHHPDVIVTDLEDESVLLNPRTQAMFTLNATGRVVWNELEAKDLDAIAAELEAQFEVDFDTAKTDAAELLDALQKAGLIVEA